MMQDFLYVVISILCGVLALLIAALRTAQISRDMWREHSDLLAKQRDGVLAMLRRDSGLLYRWTRPKPLLKIDTIRREMLDRHSVLTEFIDGMES